MRQDWYRARLSSAVQVCPLLWLVMHHQNPMAPISRWTSKQQKEPQQPGMKERRMIPAGRRLRGQKQKNQRSRGKQRLGTHPELLSQRQNKANILSEIIHDECLRRFGLIGKRKSFSWWRNEGLFVRLGKRWRQMRRKVRKPCGVKSRAA